MLIKDIKRSQYTGISGIYKLYFDNDNRFYIGSSNNLQERLQAHIRAINKKNHFNIYFQRLCLKLGLNNLRYEILQECNEEDLLKLEQKYIDTLKPEINLCKIAGRPPKNKKKGYKLSEEHKQNISKSKMGRTSNRLNYKHSKETLEKIGTKSKGRVFSEESKEKMKKAKINNKYSKLTEKQVKEIKLLVGNKFDKDIAIMFNVSRSTINQIKNNKIWKNI